MKIKVGAAISVIVVFITISIFQRAFDKNNLEYFPFYDWRLGFHEVPYVKRLYSLEIIEINGERLAEPMPLKSFLKNYPVSWIQTLDYKKVNFLAAAILERRKGKEVLQSRTLLEEKLFRNKQITSASYRVFQTTFDPLKAYRGVKGETTNTLGTFEYKRSSP
ncbi:MAG: hypothetical protein ACK5Y2_11220 [Bdellovibrionales bacterium]